MLCVNRAIFYIAIYEGNVIPDSIQQAFNLCAERAYKAFPNELRNFVLLSDVLDQPLYVSPDISDFLQENIDALQKSIQEVSRTMRVRNAVGVAYRAYSMAKKTTALIGLRNNPPGFYTENYTGEMRAHYVLEHEIGHRVVEQGFAGGHLGECAADAYATLRHIQSFGQNTDLFENAAKAYSMVLGGSSIHYTQSVFNAVKDYAKENDVSKLTLAETSELANQIAIEHQLDADVLHKIQDAFQPAHAAFREQIGDKIKVTEKYYAEDKDAYALFCHETFVVIQDHIDDPDIVKTGKEFLNTPPVKKFILESAAQSCEWQKIADFLQEDTAQSKPMKRQKMQQSALR